MGQIVPDAVERYLSTLNRLGDPVLEEVARAGEAAQLPLVDAEVGGLLRVLAASIGANRILEIGTAIGYSGIWLAEAARATGGRLITMELSEAKSKYAREMSQKAGLADFVDVRVGDAVKLIGELSVPIDFVLVDLWKDLYVPCLEAFYPKPFGLSAAKRIATGSNNSHASVMRTGMIGTTTSLMSPRAARTSFNRAS